MATDLRENIDTVLVTHDASAPVEIHEIGVFNVSSQETLVHVKGSCPVDQRAISKNVSPSTTQFLSSHVDPQSPVRLADKTWADRKKATLSPDGCSPVEWQDGKELGEHGLVDVNPSAPCEEQHSSDLRNTRSTCISTQNPQEGGENETNFQEPGAGQHQVSGGEFHLNYKVNSTIKYTVIQITLHKLC